MSLENFRVFRMAQRTGNLLRGMLGTPSELQRRERITTGECRPHAMWSMRRIRYTDKAEEDDSKNV